MKKSLSALMLLIMIALVVVPVLPVARAASYDDTSYPLYRIWTIYADNRLYMYPEPSSSGNPSGWYYKGTLLRVTEWRVYDSSTYCRVVGPDGKEGYVSKRCLLKYYDYNDSSLATYKVSSDSRVYMYPSPSSSTDSVSGYKKDVVLKVVDWNVDGTYCYAVGPDGACGFVRKSSLAYVSGSAPYSQAADVYHCPGMGKNQGTVPGSSSSGGSSSGGSSVTPTPKPSVTQTPSGAVSYDNSSYPLYRIWTIYADNQLYMYPRPDSSGNPNGWYKKGTLLRVTQWYVYGSSTYCYAVGPDGKQGYVSKRCLLRHYEYNDPTLATYTVNSSTLSRIYMYPSPSSSTDPVGVSGYRNGTTLKVVDWNLDSTYCYAVGPDGYCGFVQKKSLSYVSGSAPYSQSADLYYCPGMGKNQGTPYGGSGSSGSSSGSSGSSGGSTLNPPSGYGSGYTQPNNSQSTGTDYTVRASSYKSDADPAKALDGNAYTSWDADGRYEGEWIEISFTSSKTINGLRIQNGNRKRNSASSAYYYRFSRVRKFSLYVDGVYVLSGSLLDTADWQNIPFGYSITGKTFRFCIDSVYKGTGSPTSNYGVSIAEIMLM